MKTIDMTAAPRKGPKRFLHKTALIIAYKNRKKNQER
jgi:hypothetical protein